MVINPPTKGATSIGSAYELILEEWRHTERTGENCYAENGNGHTARAVVEHVTEDCCDALF